MPERARGPPSAPGPRARWRRGTGERVERLGHHRRRGGGQPPRHRQPVHREARVVRSSTATALGIGSQDRPVQRSVSTVENGSSWPGSPTNRALLEQAGDAQQQVRAHLVGLVDDRPRPVVREPGHWPTWRRWRSPAGGRRGRRPRLRAGRSACRATRARRDVVRGATAGRSQLAVLAGQPVDQVVDLLVGLGDDHDPLAAAGQARRRPRRPAWTCPRPAGSPRPRRAPRGARSARMASVARAGLTAASAAVCVMAHCQASRRPRRRPRTPAAGRRASTGCPPGPGTRRPLEVINQGGVADALADRGHAAGRRRSAPGPCRPGAPATRGRPAGRRPVAAAGGTTAGPRLLAGPGRGLSSTAPAR